MMARITVRVINCDGECRTCTSAQRLPRIHRWLSPAIVARAQPRPSRGPDGGVFALRPAGHTVTKRRCGLTP